MYNKYIKTKPEAVTHIHNGKDSVDTHTPPHMHSVLLGQTEFVLA